MATTQRDPKTGAVLGGTSNGNGNGHGWRVLSEKTLISIGLVPGLIVLGIMIGGKLERFSTLEAEVKKADTRLWLIEDSLETWRREVETLLGAKLSDPKPKGVNDDGFPTQMQDHQVRTASREGVARPRRLGDSGLQLPHRRGGGRRDLAAGEGGRRHRGRNPLAADPVTERVAIILTPPPTWR